MPVRSKKPAWLLVCSLLALAAVHAPATAEQSKASAPKLDVTYEPTPQPVVDAMLRMAHVGPDDFLIDLGCGDGRIPVTAAKTYGTAGLGVDLDPQRVREAAANAQKAGVTGKVIFVEADLFKTPLGKASVITLFLYPDINLKLRPRLLELAPGTRVVSHAHDMGAWRPERKQMLLGSAVYLWVVPARIPGAWKLHVGATAIALQIKQSYQVFSGTAVTGSRSQPIRNGRLNGHKVDFELALAGRLHRFAGELTPTGGMQGSNWKAVR